MRERAADESSLSPEPRLYHHHPGLRPPPPPPVASARRERERESMAIVAPLAVGEASCRGAASKPGLASHQPGPPAFPNGGCRLECRERAVHRYTHNRLASGSTLAQ